MSVTSGLPVPHTAESAHLVKFYEDEDSLFSLVGEFLANGAHAGDPLIVIARKERHPRFTAALQAHGIDAANARLHLLDAHETLSAFMTGAVPDPQRFMSSVGAIVGETIQRHGTVRAYGEMVDILWQEGNPEAAVKLEELWNELGQRHTFSLFCAYAFGRFVKESDRHLFDAVCQTHTHVIPVDTVDDEDPSRLIAALQQRTQALETEIRQRIELEKALCESLAARREGEEELRRLYELAQESHRAKDQFLATLSHELRTPLTAILGWARLLTLGGLDPDMTRTAVETIERSARTQASIVDDLLDLSKIVTGKVTMQRELVDLGSVVEEAVQTCRLAAEAKRIIVQVQLDRERAVVMGDATRLRQIVWNLFSNAIKYSDEDTRVTIAVARAGRSATITVRDNGHGIAPELLDHVFEPFRQADSSSTRGHGGLGLGLTIVKHLTELHGGTVEATSDGAGRGATFVVTLPLVKAPAQTTSERAPDAIVDLRGKRVLIVDDDAETRTLLAAVVRRFGGTIEVADRVAVAIDLLRILPIDLVVTDIAVPDRDGFALLAQIRAMTSARAVPVMAVTALSEPDTAERIDHAGFNAYLRKPVDPLVFASRVAEVLQRATVAN
ncbi:MAG TPA: ATP-binding protein [Thermoanaerobaculia bacterium]|nr:ATP-binding protein [Thermoanaerobaculia bacterium]